MLSTGHKRAFHWAGVLAFYTALFSLYFSPILVSGRLLAPGDGERFHFPAFATPWTPWSPDIFSGFPVAADPQMQTYYALRRFFSLLGAWNSYVISAYVMAACFTYGYVFTLTRSVPAALIAGIIYAGSGFFVWHLGHTAIIHGAAWIPLMLWAAEQMRRQRAGSWRIVASVAVAQCAFAAHPQILAVGLGIVIAYVAVLGGTAPTGRWWYYRSSVLSVTIGFGLAAVQLLPCVELARFSPRAHFGFEAFVQFALSPTDSIRLLFPYVFGLSAPGLYSTPYFGPWNMAETTGYVGWLAVAAAILAVLCHHREAVTRFWVAVVLLAFLLALGPSTPLAWVMYHVPLYNRFRCPARHLMEIALGVATLAGIGIATLQDHERSAVRSAQRAAGITVALAVAAALSVVLLGNKIKAMAAMHGITSVPLWPWQNPAIGLPLIMAVLSAGMIVWYSRGADHRLRLALLLLLLGTDLASMAAFAEWRFASPTHDALQLPVALRTYKEQVVSSHTRVATYEGAGAPLAAAPPNLSWLWGVPNAAGYSPLMSQRHASALPWTSRQSLQSENRVLDILAARFLLKRRSDETVEAERGPDTSLDAQHAMLPPRKIADVRTSHIVLVAALANSTSVADSVPVARVRLTTSDGQRISLPIRAGDDVSEWAYDRADLRGVIRHRRATVFSSFPAPDEAGRTFQGHFYEAVLDLKGEYQLRRLELEWVGPSGAAMTVRRVSLNDELADVSYRDGGGLSDQERWRHVEDLGEVTVYENLRAMPRAWVVPAVVTLTPTEIFAAIQHSQVPNGAEFDPRQIGLVEEPLEIVPSQSDGRGDATVVELTDTQVTLATRSTAEAFLVLSDANYPGWRASVDGRPVRIYQTDYLLRGVVIPAGEHVVTFTFRSFTFYVGLGISLLSVAGLVTQFRSHSSTS